MSRLRLVRFPVLLSILIATLLVVGLACGGGEEEEAAAAPAPTTAPAPVAATAAPAPAPTKAPAPKAATAAPVPAKAFLKAPEPGARRGGTLRYGFLADPPHFDLHQSGTTNNCTPQCPMYDKLMTLDPTDPNRSVIPDLAESFEVSADGKTFTFKLREGVKFHDGATLTSADVKATFDRIIFPPPEMNSRRVAIFTSVKEVNAPDAQTVEFVLKEPRSSAFLLDAIAVGFNVIVRKQTLDDNNNDLRKINNYPGTGPFVFKEHQAGEFWKTERNPNYWNPNLPYLDGIETFHICPWCPELAAALLSKRIDWARTIDPKTLRELADEPGLRTARYPQVIVHALFMNNNKPPFDDKRVRRAIHLILNREALVEVVKDVTPIDFGAGYIFKFSPWATPKDELRQRLGYGASGQKDKDIAEAKRLLAEAGFADGTFAGGVKELDFAMLGHPHTSLWTPAIQQMLQEVGIKTTIRPVEQSVWFEDVAAGSFHMTVGPEVMPMTDPSGYLRGWYGTDQKENYGAYSNPAVDTLLDQIDSELDPVKRQGFVRQLDELLEEEAPFAPVGWELMTDAWWDYVKGHDPSFNTGIYGAERRGTVWLDK